MNNHDETDITKMSFKQIKSALIGLGIPADTFEYLKESFRRYYSSSPKGYVTPENITKLLIANSFGCSQDNENINVTNRAAFLVCHQFTQKPHPWYWLEEGLAHDLSLTNCPTSIPDRINLPNLGLIVVPEKTITTATGNLLLLAYKIFAPDEEIIIDNVAQMGTEGTIEPQEEGFKVHFETPIGSYCLAWFGVEQGTYMNGGILALIPKKGELELFSQDMKPLLEPQGEEVETNQMLSLLLNCLVYSNPSNTDIAGEAKKRGFGQSKNTKKYHQPLWIGKGYQRVSKEEKKGTHASPIAHWRRGHWRRIAHGVGRTERRWDWIKPTLVGVNKIEKN